MFKHPFVLLFVIFSIIGILVATKQVKTPQIFMPKANVVGVSLSVLPSQMTLEQGQETTFDISLDSAEEEVSAVELALTYAQSVIQITDIKPSQKLPQIIGKELTKPGQANAILLASPGSITKSGGVIATISVKAIGSGNATIRFDTNTKVSAVGKSGDVLVGINPAEIVVNESQVAQPEFLGADPAELTTQADQLIKDYLNPESTSEAEVEEKNGFIKKYTDEVSKYIKGVINNINIRIEDTAKDIVG